MNMGAKVADLFVATETAVMTLSTGEQFFIFRGKTRVRAGHPALKQCPQFFEPFDEAVTFDSDGRRWTVQ